MSTIIMYRDNGKPSPFIFTVRHSDDEADEKLSIKEINEILENAPHPRELKILFDQIGEDSHEAREQFKQHAEFPEFYPIEGNSDIDRLVQTQAQYNLVREQCERVSQIIMMIYALQKGEQKKIYPGKMNNYAHALTEYPQKYRLLTNNLTEKALETIRYWDIHTIFSSQQPELAQVVHEILVHHREIFKARGNDGAAALTFQEARLLSQQTPSAERN